MAEPFIKKRICLCIMYAVGRTATYEQIDIQCTKQKKDFFHEVNFYNRFKQFGLPDEKLHKKVEVIILRQCNDDLSFL